jgi:hypothetical protein
VKAAAAIISYILALIASDSLRSPTGSAGQAAQQLSLVKLELILAFYNINTGQRHRGRNRAPSATQGTITASDIF